MRTTEESEVLALIQKGDVSRYEEIVQKYQRLVFSVSYGIVKNEETARDVAQECFIKAYQYMKTQDIASFKNFICRMATNKSIDFLRRCENRNLAIDTENAAVLGEDSSAEDYYLKQEKNEYVRRHVNALSEKYRFVVYDYYFNDLSYAQIAEKYNISVKTVETRLYRAKKLLKTAMKEEMI